MTNNFNQTVIFLTHLDFYPFTFGTFVQCMTAAMASVATVDLDSGFALERIRFTVPTLVFESDHETEGEIPDVEMGLVSEVVQPLVLENGSPSSNPDSRLV